MPALTARVRALLKRTAPSRLVGRGARRGFRALRQGQPFGPMLKGLTKRLQERIHSRGVLPSAATRAAGPRPGGAWSGRGGGRRRGARVDAQLSKLINSGKFRVRGGTGVDPPNLYALTRVALNALRHAHLTPVLAQRTVCSERDCIGSAADVIALGDGGRSLVVVELKCGYDGGGRLLGARRKRPTRRSPATTEAPLKLRAPLGAAVDCLMYRHLAQLCATMAMLRSERATMAALRVEGVESVRGLLLYCSDDDAEFIDAETDGWWDSQGAAIVRAL